MGLLLNGEALDIKEFLFAFEIKAKEDEGFFKLIWNKIKDAGTFILNLFSVVHLEDGRLEKLILIRLIKLPKYVYSIIGANIIMLRLITANILLKQY